MSKKMISPQIYTFETDKSNMPSVTSKSVGSGTSGSAGGTSSTGASSNNNNNNNYLLLETGFYLLQEDGSKILL